MDQQDHLKLLLKHLILQEATRFKKETGENLPRWQEKLIEYEKAGGFFVHFSTVPKLGLYTRNKYRTPTGFYVYFLDRNKMDNFAVDRPYALIVKPKPGAKLLNLQTYTEKELFADGNRLIELGYPEWVIKSAARNSRHQSPGGKMWNITRVLSRAGEIGAFRARVGMDKNAVPLKGGGPLGVWTMYFRKLGYDGVIDDGGAIIHTFQPHQAVFFNTTAVELVEVIEKNTTDVHTVHDLLTPKTT